MRQLHIRIEDHTRHRRPQSLHGSRKRCGNALECSVPRLICYTALPSDLLHSIPAHWSEEPLHCNDCERRGPRVLDHYTSSTKIQRAQASRYRPHTADRCSDEIHLARSIGIVVHFKNARRWLACRSSHFGQRGSKIILNSWIQCFIDHSILEDMPLCGSVYHWTSSGFESVHRKLQLRMSQDARNCEETIVKK